MHKLFPSQQEDEEIFLVIRQHWFYLFLKLTIWLMFAIGIVLFKRYMPGLAPDLYTEASINVTKLFLQVYTLFLTLSLFLIWMLYYLNVHIISDRRIVDINQEGLFFHTISELHIENIEDVTSETKGLFGTLFNYGMVYVQTAGTIERFEFVNVPNPASVERLILDLYEKLPHEGMHKK
jgi:hypothetical protein